MHKSPNKFNFNAKFSEPIMISGKIFSIRILSGYDFIIFTKRYKRLWKLLFHRDIASKFYKNMVEKACLISMCLYTPSTNSFLFPNAMAVLRNLTPFEIDFIYKHYIKWTKRLLNYNRKTANIFESVKKHGYQQNSQEIKI